MSFVHLIGTGGTIASRAETGGSTVADSADQVLGTIGLPTRVSVEDVLHINSFHLTFKDLLTIHRAVAAACKNPDVSGVVITHGTDTMEETAFFLSLLHDSDKPVILTGAQRAADQPNTDGPENLRHAVVAAGSPQMRGAGVIIGFEAQFHAARYTRKRHTLATTTFSGGTRVAQLYDNYLLRLATPNPYPVLDAPDASFGALDIPIIDASPNSNAKLFYAALENNADAIVLQGVGAGNAPPTFTDAVKAAVAAQVPVVLSTRVPTGPVAAIYGNGGAVTLLEAGALSAGELNTYQVRILLAILVSQQLPVETFRDTFAAQTS